MTELSRAVFVSYASQDAQAAQRICELLRNAGIEVWFDKSELRGGDAWDQSIRRQIKNCALFIPIVSRHTHDRAEGYFRLEWKLAVDRSHLIVANRAFLLPIVIDDTDEDDENVPDRFREVQWTRLPDGQAPPAFVQLVQRLLSGETAAVPERARPTAPANASDAPARAGLSGRRMVLVYGAIAALTLSALGYLGIEHFNAAKPSVLSTSSIAVLPLANESGEASDQYFSDGISEDLITALSQFPGLKVIGRTSAFQFRDAKEDSRSIGIKLGVAHLLEGSLRRAGDVVRVSAELIDTADGITLWSRHYDRPYKNLFTLQDEITLAVATELRVQLLQDGHAGVQSDRPPSGSLEAYNALLKGRFFDSQLTEAGESQAVALFEQATQLDPNYAVAWAELAGELVSIGGGFHELSQMREEFARARQAVDRALAIAPDLALAHVVRGGLLQESDFDWRGAEAEFQRAMELAPNDGDVKVGYAYQLATTGKLEPAIDLTRQALATEPLRGDLYDMLAIYLTDLDRLEEAERAIHQAIELQPTGSLSHKLLTVVKVQRGDAKGALSAAQQEPPGYLRDVALALAYQIGGDRGAADSALKNLIDSAAHITPYQIASVYAQRNDPNATFLWLDRAWDERDNGLVHLLLNPLFRPVKNDPRFAAFCRKVGLPTPAEVAAKQRADKAS